MQCPRCHAKNPPRAKVCLHMQFWLEQAETDRDT
jgi:hypothetical protein